MAKKVLLGNKAIVRGALEAGVSFVTGYPGCPSAEIGEEFLRIAKKEGIYAEWATNEKVALESAIGASFSGLKSLINMKSFGINVCSDSLLPLAYTGVKAPMVIVVADDPSCHSSAQSEQDSRGYAFLSHIPVLEPADVQECYEFTKLGFEISEKFNIPVILRTTTRVNHQRAIVEFNEIASSQAPRNDGNFVKNPHQFCTMPPRVLEMKKELLEKMEKIKQFAEKSKINKIENSLKIGNSKLGIITSGVSYLYVKEALGELGLNLPILKLGFFYPLPDKTVLKFIKGQKKVLVVEELNGYIENGIKIIAKDANLKTEILGKNVLPEIGELNTEKIILALLKVLKLKIGKLENSLKIESLCCNSAELSENLKLEIPRRFPKLCEGCPHLYTLAAIKRAAPENTVFGGDIGCYMIAGYPPHNMQDYVFSMGSSMGISHGIVKATSPAFAKASAGKQKVISLIGDATFFHAGIQGLINMVYNKSNSLVVILDNRITAMTGHQPNPGMGKNGMGETVEELKIEDIVRACGVKHIKVLDPINVKELEETVKDFLTKDEVSVIISKRICALLERRQPKSESLQVVE